MQRTQCYQKINTIGQTRTYQKQDSYIQQYIQRQRIWMKVSQCSIEKEEAILDALKCFKMIKDDFSVYGRVDLQKFEPFPKNPAISKVFREIGLADELGSGMRNTYKYTQLYSGQNPLFEEGDIFRTIIPLKKIATQKVGGGNVPHDVPHSVPHDVPQGRDELIEFIKAQVRLNNKITRQAIAEGAGVSVKTIQRTLKEIDNLQYVGSGNNGHWELNE